MIGQTSTRRTLLKTGAKAGLLAAFGATAIRPSYGQKLDTFTIAASPFINQAAIFMAGELGYFAKVGVDPKIKSFPDGSLIVAPMISGEVDLGVVTCSAGLFNSLSRGAPIKSILCNGQAQKGRAITATVMRKDHYESGLRTLADLKAMKGKIVAVGATGSINHYGMATGLRMAGLDPVNDVKWQTSVQQPDIVKQLSQKQVDVADITYHLAYLAEEQGLGTIIISRDEILPNSQTAMIAVRDDFLAKRRDTVVRFAMAYIHSARLFNKVAGAPTEHRDIIEMITKYIFVKDVGLLTAVAPHWEWISENGAPNEASVLAQQDFWSGPFKLVERKVTPAQIFEPTVAAEALKRLEQEKPFG
ncbi:MULTISPECIES: ABC transporter substrate-binding protein [unclassified Beijerinckia]|uniref:ABC transporter substrate-binding protein n=1 Tax=unclassified Beijerinckia TaxID=2638183 RepID=UPI000899D537|nr:MULTISPECIES: ABC transporter substrate-binding protein [unclassified Beijerinckia]MDH7798365.1 NitT/TauT family transport system substrate-binding protein [Beijerinckia sp. GAS462]SED18495.1 NitT/TauT family transport system substrate-binding protein [Beijerinckia sp. 28-YEA-48]